MIVTHYNCQVNSILLTVMYPVRIKSVKVHSSCKNGNSIETKGSWAIICLICCFVHSHNDIIINNKARIVKYLAFVCKRQNFNFTQLTNGQSKKKIMKTNPDNFERCTVGFTLSHYSNILLILTVLHFVWHSFWIFSTVRELYVHRNRFKYL